MKTVKLIWVDSLKGGMLINIDSPKTIFSQSIFNEVPEIFLTRILFSLEDLLF